MKTAIRIGVGAKTLNKVDKLVMSIITSAAADEVKLKALDVVQHTTAITGVTLSNCSIVNNPHNGTS